MHKETVFNLKSVLEQWKKKLSSGSHVVLGKCFNFYFCLEKAAEPMGIMSSAYLNILSPNFSSLRRSPENLLVTSVPK